MNHARQIDDRQMQLVTQWFQQQYDTILQQWMQQQLAASSLRKDLISEDEIRDTSAKILKSINSAIANGKMNEVSKDHFNAVKANLKQVSERYALLGFSPSETAHFICSLKDVLITLLQQHYTEQPTELLSAILLSNQLIDALGLYTFECFSNIQQALLDEQAHTMNQMATPVMQVWQDILMIPIVGVVDSARAQIIMDAMLEGLSNSDSEIIILDIQGVASIDSAVANHLLKITKAVSIMGCHCIISGVSSHVAQAMANLGLDLGNVNSAPTLRKALRMALAQLKVINSKTMEQA